MLVRSSWNGALISLLILASLGAGCESSPTRPSAVATSVETTTPRSMPSVAAITPSAGSTAGSTWGVITGTGFERAASVRLGDQQVSVFVESSTLIRFWTTPHAAGAVDVVVTNPGNQAATLPRAYVFAAPGTFDFNGDWVAHAGNEFATDMRFTIRNDVLVSLSCGDQSVPFAPATAVALGQFSSPGSEGVVLSGRLVSPTTAVGTIGMVPCASTWWADKSGATAP